MIVRDLHVVSTIFPPSKTHPPLIIDSDAVLSLAVFVQTLEPIAGKHGESLERIGRIEDPQTLFRLVCEGSPLRNGVPVEEPLCITIMETLDHAFL
jgi:hypothetical protein